MFAAAYVISSAAGLAEDLGDRVVVEARARNLELSWADTEERLSGMVLPAHPRAGEPMHVVVNVGSFDGKPFQGPVTLQLRKDGQLYGAGVTVPGDGKGWKADFRPEEPGKYSLDVSFRTTHLKVLHAPIEVVESKIPPIFVWILGLGLVVCVVGYAVFRVVRAQKPSPPPESTGG